MAATGGLGAADPADGHGSGSQFRFLSDYARLSYPHYAPLPNLEIFANAGFPFTRFADLSETTVVLPPTPTEQEI
jgi:hypothetical protein